MKTFFLFLFFSLLSLFAFSQQQITLLFVGDLMQHQAQIDAARTSDKAHYHYEACFSYVSSFIQRADIAIANFEVTLGGTPYRGYPAFSAPDEFLTAVRDAGFDVLLTANNHCLDRGGAGLERTISLMDSLGISHVGTYSDANERKRNYPLFIRKNGFCIALLNYTYGTNGLHPHGANVVNYIDRTVMLHDIRCAQACRPDAIIACIHWGEEYRTLPNKDQRDLADWLIQHGVTHVIGGHPHVVQPIEVRTAGLQQHVVAYSLGNFISNMSAPHTDGGMILSLTLEKYPLPPLIPPAWPHDENRHSLHAPTILYPYARTIDCSYRLVWTGRPQLTRLQNFVLFPDDYPADSLPDAARRRYLNYMNTTQSFLQQHNVGLQECE